MFFFALVFVLFTQLAVALDCAQEDTITPLPQCGSTSCPSGCEYIHSASTICATETIVRDGGQIIVIQSAVISNYYHCCNQSRMVSALQALETTVRAEKPDITNQSNVTQITAADAEFLCSKYGIFCSVGESHCLTVEKHNTLSTKLLAPEVKSLVPFSTLLSSSTLFTSNLERSSTLVFTLGLNLKIVLFISVLITARFSTFKVETRRSIRKIQQYVENVSEINRQQLSFGDKSFICTDFDIYRPCTDFDIYIPCIDFNACTPCTDLVVYKAPSDLILYNNQNRYSDRPCTRPILLVEWHTPCIDSEPTESESSSSSRRTSSIDSFASSVSKSTFDFGPPIILPKRSIRNREIKRTSVEVIQPDTADIEIPEVNSIGLETPAVETVDIDTDIDTDIKETVEVETPKESADIETSIETVIIKPDVAEAPAIETADIETIIETNIEKIAEFETPKEPADTEASIETVIIKPDVAKAPTVEAPKKAPTKLNATRKCRVNIVDYWDSVNQDMKKTLVSQGRPSCIPFDYRSIARRAMDEAASAVYSLTGQDFVTKTTAALEFKEEVSQQNVDILVALVKVIETALSRGIEFDYEESITLRQKMWSILARMENIREDLDFKFSVNTKNFCPRIMIDRVMEACTDPKVWLNICWYMLMTWISMTTDVPMQEQQNEQIPGKKSRWWRRKSSKKEDKEFNALLARIASSS